MHKQTCKLVGSNISTKKVPEIMLSTNKIAYKNWSRKMTNLVGVRDSILKLSLFHYHSIVTGTVMVPISWSVP